jgi:transposase
MELITILNHCHRSPGFVYQGAKFSTDKKSIEVRIRPRSGSLPICSGCHERRPGYDHLDERRFEFIPVWGFLVFFLYRMRRVNCGPCGVVVEEVPWGSGKHHLTRVYMQFLAHWARKLSWKEVAESFQTSWEKVYDAVEYVVQWGLQHRTLGPIFAIGVDEIQYAKGHKYLTLVYEIDDLTRLLWVGQERTVASFEGFFAMLGPELSAQIEFVCSDMWKPYLRVIREKCSQALHILDRFHIVAKMNDALDEVRAAEARRLAAAGHEPLLKKSRWCLLKRKQNLTSDQKFRLRDLLRYNLKTVRAYLLKEVLGIRVSRLGRQIPHRVVPAGHALPHRTDEESRPHATSASRSDLELLQGQKAVLQRDHRRPQQQGQSHHEKILRVPDLQSHRTGSLPRSWEATRAGTHPQILLTRQ